MATEIKAGGSKRIWLVVVLVAALAAIGSCAVGVNSFFEEERSPVQRITTLKTIPPTRLEISAKTILADPIRGLMKVELEFHPKGDLLESNGHDMARDVHVITNSTVAPSEIILKKHHQAHSREITLSLVDGDVALYPIDKYNTSLQLEAFIERGGDDEVAVPLVVLFSSHNHLLHAEAALGADSEPHELNVQMKLSRPAAVLGFAWFMNAIMAMLGICAALVTYNVAYRGKKLEPNLMVWMSALLFVLPTIRNSLPGTPPLGSLTDFMVFFWVEAVISICLLIMVLTWYRRAPDD